MLILTLLLSAFSFAQTNHCQPFEGDPTQKAALMAVAKFQGQEYEQLCYQPDLQKIKIYDTYFGDSQEEAEPYFRVILFEDVKMCQVFVNKRDHSVLRRVCYNV